MIKKAKKIQRMVEQMLDQYKITAPPINVGKIAESQGIRVIEGDLGDISGILFRDGSDITIGINQSHTNNRKRFTTAHELGHLMLHSNEPLHVDRVFAIKLRDKTSSEAVDLDEIEANAFAAELLMPTTMIQKKMQGIVEVLDYEKADPIAKLAREFDVSTQAMTIRLINLGYLKDSI